MTYPTVTREITNALPATLALSIEELKEEIVRLIAEGVEVPNDVSDFVSSNYDALRVDEIVDDNIPIHTDVLFDAYYLHSESMEELYYDCFGEEMSVYHIAQGFYFLLKDRLTEWLAGDEADEWYTSIIEG